MNTFEHYRTYEILARERRHDMQRDAEATRLARLARGEGVNRLQSLLTWFRSIVRLPSFKLEKGGQPNPDLQHKRI